MLARCGQLFRTGLLKRSPATPTINTVLYESTAGIERMNVLNVAEKNDAAKSIAAVMSRGAAQRVGLLSY